MATKLGRLGDEHQKPHLILGDYNASNVRFQEPIPGRGLRRKLKSLGFELSLIHEYLSTQICPLCLRRTLCCMQSLRSPACA
ncbi:hypothetical protein FB192DRAFT_1272260 [Mucor lusitanicus]|uniref:Endonuclease/exonuclease/phosphatase domain-containing protein n=1 Tax=Mucor circinelloides f. lusitanicus TaxID=29924 RepID=A0A8H4BQ23_MUCCL|nr:hypothetical protein FB192DRAFT_1272260 [Mucor lusitanicus]